MCFLAQSISAQDAPIQTHLKLMVLNENYEILLVKFQGVWEPAGKRYNQKSSLQDTIKLMGTELGVTEDTGWVPQDI